MHPRGRVVAALVVAVTTATLTAVAPQPPQRFSATAVAVIVDATVRDRAGRPMPCLDASQFEVLEEGVPQQISSFEAVDVPDCEPPAEAGAPGVARPQPLARVLSTPPLVTALVFEELGEHARVAAWQAARAFVEEGRRPGEFVGVFVVERAVLTMVPYTRDTEALLAGLRRAAMRPGCPIYLEPDVASAATPSGCSNGLPGNLRTGATLKGLQTVAGTLAHMPGRKNIVLFSEGFRLSTQDNTVDIFRHLTSYSNQSAVTFHTIDAAGPRMGRIKGLDQDPTAYLERVALDTGGQHVRATNDITGAVRRLTADMRDYYRLTYSPTNTALDGRFRAITVRVRDPEAVVTARNGYLASPRAATPMVAPYDVAPHVLLDAQRAERKGEHAAVQGEGLGQRASGTSFDFRSARSLVTSGTLCTILVAAINRSAGSPTMSRRVLSRAISRVSGHTCTRANTRTTSASSRSMAIRPNCDNFAISQKTMAEMLQRLAASSRVSAAVNLPATACSSTCVSRLSIPLEPGGEDVALDDDLALERPDEAR